MGNFKILVCIVFVGLCGAHPVGARPLNLKDIKVGETIDSLFLVLNESNAIYFLNNDQNLINVFIIGNEIGYVDGDLFLTIGLNNSKIVSLIKDTYYRTP
jgi:hypothetical protein